MRVGRNSGEHVNAPASYRILKPCREVERYSFLLVSMRMSGLTFTSTNTPSTTSTPVEVEVAVGSKSLDGKGKHSNLQQIRRDDVVAVVPVVSGDAVVSDCTVVLEGRERVRMWT